MVNSIKRLIARVQGASAIEYVLLASLIAAVIVATVTIMGGKVYNLYEIIEGLYPGE